MTVAEALAAATALAWLIFILVFAYIGREDMAERERRHADRARRRTRRR